MTSNKQQIFEERSQTSTEKLGIWSTPKQVGDKYGNQRGRNTSLSHKFSQHQNIVLFK